jgi:sulfatase modifying factor 1
MGIALGACASPPPPAPVVVVVPIAPTAAPAPSAEEAPPVVCPPDMIHLAGGPMRLPPRSLQMPDFCLDQREVTAGDYAACVERGGCDEEELECDDVSTYKKPELASHPINCVSWKQASKFCRDVGKRLPTFEEWEWAAQGRTEERRFAWGATEPAPGQICWARGSQGGTCPVGSFPQSRTAQGIDDMFGNVWEWLSPAERRGLPNVARGASWHNDSLDTLEGENAGGFVQGFVRNDVVGFRCAHGG